MMPVILGLISGTAFGISFFWMFEPAGIALLCLGGLAFAWGLKEYLDNK
jgi:hypothetical protein